VRQLRPAAGPGAHRRRRAAEPARAATPHRGASFKLNDLRLNGVKALSNEELQSITAPYIGRDVTLTELEELAKAITARYKERGYFLAQAVVPVQTVRDGIVEISVIEGRLGKVDVVVAPDAPLAESRVRGFLAPLQPGEAVSAPAYERAMLLLSDQPGVKVSSGLQEGAQAGTTDLSVEVAAAPRWAFTAEGDNHGTQESGRYRVGGTARWLSPFGIGDNLDMRVMVSDSNALQFGRIAYEAPIGTSGLRAGIGLSRVSYELGGQFIDLDARGRANVLDLSLSYPLIRQRQQNLFLRLGVDVKDLTDELRAADFTSKKRVNGLSAGLDLGAPRRAAGRRLLGQLGHAVPRQPVDQGRREPRLRPQHHGPPHRRRLHQAELPVLAAAVDRAAPLAVPVGGRPVGQQEPGRL
jgi:hemolysin activation/secretion protein